MSSKRKAGSCRFKARIARNGTQYCVDVPASITRSIGTRGRVPVSATVDRGFPFHATFLPRGDGGHRLFLNAEARAGAKIGDRVTISARIISADRDVGVPPDLASALREEDALEAWASFPPGKREHIIGWIEGAVHEATRVKRIAKALEVTQRRREKQLAKSGR